MALRLLGHIELPTNRSEGGFDHADIYPPTDRLYVAHTSNNAIDVIDGARDRYIESIPGFTAVAGTLVSEACGLVFTSNRGENTVSVFAPGAERDAFKIAVGVKPNGLAFDPARGVLIVANVGDPSIPDSHSVSVVDIALRLRIAEIELPGRTRWAIYDAARQVFFVNIMSPARIIAIDARDPTKISQEHEVPAAGPHGLELDPATGRCCVPAMPACCSRLTPRRAVCSAIFPARRLGFLGKPLLFGVDGWRARSGDLGVEHRPAEITRQRRTEPWYIRRNSSVVTREHRKTVRRRLVFRVVELTASGLLPSSLVEPPDERAGDHDRGYSREAYKHLAREPRHGWPLGP
jgi:hypothetical protein